MIYAPISGRSNTPNSALIALNGTTELKHWTYLIPAINRTIHSVPNPILAAFGSDGTGEAIASMIERQSGRITGIGLYFHL